MNKRTAGVLLVATSAFLYSTRYIAAAIFGSGVSSWDEQLFRAMLSYVGNGLLVWSVVTALLGAAYLVWAELEDRDRRK